jgi:S-DNA-T family DNA segregation ATPase FtsK/SpoIIIE
MHLRLTIRGRDGLCRDVMVSAPAGTPLGDVSPTLQAVAGQAGSDVPLWCGSVRLTSSARLGSPGLMSGEVITVGRRVGVPDGLGVSGQRLEIIGGPDAGRGIPLRRGVLTIGRGPGNDLPIPDADVSRLHATVTVTASGLTVRDLESTNGTFLDEQQVDPDGSPLRPGQLLRLGDSVLRVSATEEPAAAACSDPVTARWLINRAPRVHHTSLAEPPDQIEVPQRATGAARATPWLSAVLPAAVGGAIAAATGNLLFLAFGVMGPLALAGASLGDRMCRWRGARSFRSRRAVALAQIDNALAQEADVRRRAHPDPATILTAAVVPSHRLWERRRTDADVLEVRLGLGDRPSATEVREGQRIRPAGTLRRVPLIVNLRVGPLGITGPRCVALAVARWLLGQLAVLHSPSDLDLAVLLSDDAAPAWTWTRWLPHLGDRIAHTRRRRTALLNQLQKTIASRASLGSAARPGWSGRWLVVLVDRVSALHDEPGLNQLLAAGPAVGITAICLDEDERALPSECAVIARVGGETGTRFAAQHLDAPGSAAGTLDLVSTLWADRVSRALAPLADSEPNAEQDSLPAAVRLLDLVRLAEPSPQRLIELWSTSTEPTTPIGMGPAGPVLINLIRDGPHVLVAGTTGSGKSELLQTVVAGLAATNPPDALSFVLIDYKGGASFAECAALPHAVGVVTDLDAHLTQRALRSLEAELRHRERLFAAAGCGDLVVYRASKLASSQPLARLVIVVDEFATLADELPEFLAGLVDVAQRGRSLGVHLVLATQRPSGAVSPEIRANTALRIALRVTDAAESIDVLGSAVAAGVDKDRPGRGFFRTGSALTEMQTAMIGCRSQSAPEGISVTALDEWGQPPATEPQQCASRTDLQRLVTVAQAAAGILGMSPPRSPWLPPLPTRVPLSDLADGSTPGHVPIALADLPSESTQRTQYVDLDTGGAMLLAGGPRSGRSTMLRTLAAAAAAQLNPDQLHLYVIDCAGGALHGLAELAHCGTVATRDAFPTVDRLLRRLATQMNARQQRLGHLDAGSMTEANACGEAMPSLLVLLDGWEGFVAAAEEFDGGSSIELLLTLLHEAGSAAMTVVIAGDRSTLSGRLAGRIGTRYLLRLADRADYALAGVNLRSVPADMPPGRAIQAHDGVEVQFATLGDDPTPMAQWRAVREIAYQSRLCAEPATMRIEIHELPRRIVASALPHVDPPYLVLGVGGDSAGMVAVDLFAGPARFLVAGPPGSGRSSTLILLCEQAVALGHEVLVAAPERSPLVATATRLAIRLLTPHGGTGMAQVDPDLILVDDSAAFADTAVGEELLHAASRPFAIVAAVASDELAFIHRGIAAEVRRARTGLLLMPQLGDGNLLGIRLAHRAGQLLPGRGVLVNAAATVLPDEGSGGLLPVQVALPGSSE